MHRDRFVLALIACAVLVVGLFALASPTALDAYDPWGFRIECGSGVAVDYDQAEIAERAGRSGAYVNDCESAIGWRRTWSGATVLLGIGLAVAVAMCWQRHAPAGSGPD